MDYFYGGHGFGLFNLDDEEIRPIYHFDLEKFDPPPFCLLLYSYSMVIE